MESDALLMLALAMEGASPDEVADTISRSRHTRNAGTDVVRLPASGIEKLEDVLDIEVLERGEFEVTVRLPPGASIVPQEHPMWSHICCDGEVVAKVFDKGSFYRSENEIYV